MTDLTVESSGQRINIPKKNIWTLRQIDDETTIVFKGWLY